MPCQMMAQVSKYVIDRWRLSCTVLALKFIRIRVRNESTDESRKMKLLLKTFIQMAPISYLTRVYFLIHMEKILDVFRMSIK